MTDSIAVVPVAIPPAGLAGDLRLADAARGVVIFAHGSGSSRLSPRNQQVALSDVGMITLRFDLLTETDAAGSLYVRHKDELPNIFMARLRPSRTGGSWSGLDIEQQPDHRLDPSQVRAGEAWASALPVIPLGRAPECRAW